MPRTAAYIKGESVPNTYAIRRSLLDIYIYIWTSLVDIIYIYIYGRVSWIYIIYIPVFTRLHDDGYMVVANGYGLSKKQSGKSMKSSSCYNPVV